MERVTSESEESAEPAEPDTVEPGAAESDAAESDALESETAEPDTAGSDTAGHPAGRIRRWAAMVLAGAGCVLLGLALAAELQAHSLRSDRASHNAALTDAATTSQVKRQVSSAIDTVFSYNYADTGATRAAAQRLLTGPAVREYDSLFKLVEQDAPAQHLVLTTKVTSSGVELLVGDRARVLIFANQRDTRMTTHQTSYAGAMFAVTALQRGGQWKIENIDTFTGGS